MIRQLLESTAPINGAGMFMAAPHPNIGSQTSERMFACVGVFVMPVVCTLTVVVFKMPTSFRGRHSLPAYCLAALEMIDFGVSRILMTILLVHHMSLNTNYFVLVISFHHLGALIGAVFFALIAKAGRKPAMLVHMLFTVIVYIILSIMAGAFMQQDLSLFDRDYATHGHGGNRKVRGFVNPNLAKGITGEFGFEGAFGTDFNHICLMFIFVGFALTIIPVCQTVIVDVWPFEMTCRDAFFFYAIIVWGWAAQTTVNSSASWWYVLMDIPGTYYLLICLKVVMGSTMFAMAESKNLERDTNITTSPCYLKALYYGTYIWPQGVAYLGEMCVFMIHDKQHWNSATAGYLFAKAAGGRWFNYFLFALVFRWLHIPTIGSMFFLGVCAPNALNLSLCMDMFQFWRIWEASEFTYIFITLYPAFVGQYMALGSVPLFLGIANGLHHLGDFLAIARWPNQMFCGDPMNCWRSQYLYSHAIFYNCNGDGGNINYVNWYCFAKSQRRQCCCPYRKLKQEAPEKCCPPCCMGPLVEETGGCPCPCCCASCST